MGKTVGVIFKGGGDLILGLTANTESGAVVIRYLWVKIKYFVSIVINE